MKKYYNITFYIITYFCNLNNEWHQFQQFEKNCNSDIDHENVVPAIKEVPRTKQHGQRHARHTHSVPRIQEGLGVRRRIIFQTAWQTAGSSKRDFEQAMFEIAKHLAFLHDEWKHQESIESFFVHWLFYSIEQRWRLRLHSSRNHRVQQLTG